RINRTIASERRRTAFGSACGGAGGGPSLLAGEPSAGRACPPRSLSVPPGRPMPSWRAEPIGALSPSGRAATIRRSSEFLEVRSRGRRRVGKRLVLYVLAGEGPARAGFICGRGVGGAV